MKKILVTHQLPAEAFKDINNIYQIVMPENGHIKKDILTRELSSCNAILPTYAFKVTKEIIDAASNLEIIANFGAGYDNIDVKYAKTKNILVTNSPEPVIEPTAELACSLMMAVARKICECDRKLRTLNSMQIDVMNNLGISLYGKTLGIIGMGAIGQAVARRAYALGMRIVYYNRHQLPKEIELKYKANRRDLYTLLEISDVISLHVPATTETYHMINKSNIKRMKRTAILINTARGNIINENDLIEALENNSILGAGLDVYEHEPQIPTKLLELENVVLSPHNGTGTWDARIASTRYALQNIINFFEGRAVRSIVS